MRNTRACCILLILFAGGCCVQLVTGVRNESGRDIILTIEGTAGAPEILKIPKGHLKICDGDPTRNASHRWTIDDGRQRMVYDDVSPIRMLSGPYVSESRFTHGFPCNRVTRHVRL